MRKGAKLIIATLLFVLGFGLAKITQTNSVPRQEHPETAYERVARTGVLRCAYMQWPPFMARDPNTGTFSGYNYDMIQAVADSLGLKIEWTAEIAPGTQVDSLKSEKADAICTCEGPLSTAASVHLAYTEPLAYFPFYAFARQNDDRFVQGIERLNAEDIRISVIDGDASGEAARVLFPKATRMSLPQLADPGQMMQDVAANKSDIVINDDMSMKLFMQNNPGKLKKVSDKVLLVVPNTFSTLRQETALVDMLSQGIRNVRDRGIEAQILKKYGIGTEIPLYLVAPDYVQP